MPTKPLRHRIAHDLLSIQAISLSPAAPYTWASGLRSPIYCDNRVTLAYPRIRRHIAEGFAALMDVNQLTADAIVGTATAGIAHAAWLAEHLHLPMAYVRSKPKAHGQGNQIEGRLTQGQRVVVIEDLVSTGGSSIKVVHALEAAGVNVEAVLAIFSYGLPAADAAFAEAQTPLYTLTTFPSLLEVALSSGQLDQAAIDSLKAWHTNPKAWSDAVEAV